MWDLILSGGFALGFLLSVRADYCQRQKFNALCETSKEGAHTILTGMVQTETPVELQSDEQVMIESSDNNFIAKLVETQKKTYHTFHTVYENGLYFTKTHEIWIPDTIKTTIAENIMIDNTKLSFHPDVRIQWNSKKEMILNNKQIYMYLLRNNQMRSVFVEEQRSNDPKVKIFGNKEFVENTIRSDYYGINNFKTTILYSLLVTSGIFFVDSLMGRCRCDSKK